MGIFDFLFKKTRHGLVFHNSVLWGKLNKLYKASRVILRDRRYVCIGINDFLDLQKKARKERKIKYEKEKFDCDDFAITYWADIKRFWARSHSGNESLACGIVDGEFTSKVDEKPFRHTMIWVFTKDNGLIFIEPQIDAIPIYGVNNIIRIQG